VLRARPPSFALFAPFLPPFCPPFCSPFCSPPGAQTRTRSGLPRASPRDPGGSTGYLLPVSEWCPTARNSFPDRRTGPIFDFRKRGQAGPEKGPKAESEKHDKSWCPASGRPRRLSLLAVCGPKKSDRCCPWPQLVQIPGANSPIFLNWPCFEVSTWFGHQKTSQNSPQEGPIWWFVEGFRGFRGQKGGL
jgi:hypothetical protein